MVIVELNGLKPITDKNGRYWIPIHKMIREGIFDPRKVDVIKTEDGEFFEVVGYSDKRKALWVEPIDVENEADNLDKELKEYVERMGDN